MQPIAWSKFRLYKVKDSDLDDAPSRAFPMQPDVRYKAVNGGVSEPACQINFEDFFKGPDVLWTVPHDEVHYVTKGRAEITYHLPPLMRDGGKVVAEAGDVYLIPRGTHIVWRVLSDEPFRHLCICYPHPGYPTPLAASVKDRAT